MPAKTAVPTAAPLPMTALVNRQVSTIDSDEQHQRQQRDQTRAPTARTGASSGGGQHQPDDERRRPVAGHDIVDEAVANAGARRDERKHDERQHPGADVDHRQADQDREPAAEAQASGAELIGNADPADDQRRQRHDDGEEGIPETVGGKVEQAQPSGLPIISRQAPVR